MSELALQLIAENKKTRAAFLDLGNCGLTEVSDEIGELVWLEELSFSAEWWEWQHGWNEEKRYYSKNTANRNNIAQISCRLGFLKQLKKLWITHGDRIAEKLGLSDLSPLIGLDNLQELHLYGTQVNDLSPLATLKNLQQLYVFNTQIFDLSPLAALSNLQILSVSNTKITDISPLATLSNLQELFANITGVNDLVPLSGLTQLRIFDISNTKITDLSPLLTLIKNGLEVKWKQYGQSDNTIYVENCPLTNPPEAIVKQGNAAILNYFKEKQEQGIDHLYEAKLLIVGAGGAGKTSLIRRLYQTTKPLPEEHETTKGIDIYPHKFTVQDSLYPNGREFRLNVWDFAGQEQYRPADTFFFTQRSLYVLLDDTRNDDKTVQDACFKYWLEAVDCFSDNSPVLIFQNEKGGRSKAIDLAGIKAKFENVKDCYSGNLEHKNAADKVREAIEFYAKQLPHIGEELPAKWINIRAEIEQAAEQQATISQQDYFKLYEKHLPFDREKALHLSQYLHDLGVFLHFQKDNLLKRVVILQNQWATEAVFKMLDDETVKNQHGRFTEEDCERLWQDSDYADMHPELLALMEKFELCYLLPDSTPKKWLAPQLLPPSKPTELNDWAEVGDLVLRYRYEFLPKGMINRLMVRKHYYVPRPELAWLTGVLFERNGTQVLVELSAQGNEIVFRARGIERKDLLGAIAFELEALNATFKGLPEKVTVLIPCCCDTCAKQAEPKFFEQADLLRRKELGKATIECPASFDNVNVLRLLDGIQTKKLPKWSKEENMKKIFISYSKHNHEYKDTLIDHLEGLRNNIVTWHDRDIKAGEEWDERIKDELNKADIVLYLVSHHSMNVDYIKNVELPLIEQRCLAKECKLIPVIVDFCRWQKLDFAKYNALPEKGIPVTDTSHWINENQAWLKVVEGIEQIVSS
ncbi:MAG: COR domain-containing protein [Methylococcales bacterium]